MKRVYKVLPICLIVLGLVCPGCGPSSTAQLEENKALVRRVIEEVWNQGKLDVAGEIFATDYIFHAPLPGEVRGPEGLKQRVSMYRTGVPDLQLTIEDQVAEGDKVVTRWTSTGTHKGKLMGIPPTGVKMTVTGIEISRIAGGKIMKKGENWDALGMWQQLGVAPPIRKRDKK